jgi:hypothetical protein
MCQSGNHLDWNDIIVADQVLRTTELLKHNIRAP